MKPLSSDSALHVAHNMKSRPGIKDIHFVGVPPDSASATQEERVVYGIPCVTYATHPPSNLLAVLQIVDEGRSVPTHVT